MEAINESMHLEKEWFADANKQTMETLPEFMRHVMNDYTHDYGTICHAIAACALAAACAANRSDGARGGITGFQAGFVKFDFLREWEYTNNKCGLRIVDYDNMLYPQYKYMFEKTITKDTWEALQREAQEMLEKNDAAAYMVKEHWKSIAEDKEVPFGYRIRER